MDAAATNGASANNAKEISCRESNTARVKRTGKGANHLPAARQLAWLAVKANTNLTDEERTLLDELRQDEHFEQAYTLVQRFTHLIQQRNADGLKVWMNDCAASKQRSLQTFAETLRHDSAAVRAALSEPWSSRQVEGQITRVKMVKRQMFGRASFDLLRRRVLSPT